MIPGPVSVRQEILSEMSSPLVAHYGKEWTKFYNETIKLMKNIFQTVTSDIFLIPGSGSAGLDAAIGTVVGSQMKALVLINGFFGERLHRIAKSYSDEVETIDFELGKPVKPTQLEKVLQADETIETVLVVHCETSIGILNPIKEIGEICDEHGALLIVDAVSSLGGDELNMDAWNIDICVSASQKGLETPPGVSLVAVSQRIWDLLGKVTSPGWYLNLRTWKEYSIKWSDWHPFPVTLPVNNILALRKSIEKILEEGLEDRFQRHKKMTSFLRQGLTNLGFELFIEDSFRSNTVTSAKVDSRLSANKLLKSLKDKHNIQISGSLGELKGKVVRIGHMGPSASLDAIIPLLFAIEEILRAAGANVKVGQSIQDIKLDA